MGLKLGSLVLERIGRWERTAWETFGFKEEEIIGIQKKYIIRNFIIFLIQVMSLRRFNKNKTGMVGHVERIEQMGNAYRLFVGKPQAMRLIGTGRSRWEDDSKTNLR